MLETSLGAKSLWKACPKLDQFGAWSGTTAVWTSLACFLSRCWRFWSKADFSGSVKYSLKSLSQAGSKSGIWLSSLLNQSGAWAGTTAAGQYKKSIHAINKLQTCCRRICIWIYIYIWAYWLHAWNLFGLFIKAYSYTNISILIHAWNAQSSPVANLCTRSITLDWNAKRWRSCMMLTL